MLAILAKIDDSCAREGFPSALIYIENWIVSHDEKGLASALIYIENWIVSHDEKA